MRLNGLSMDRAEEEKIIKNTCCLTHRKRKMSLLHIDRLAKEGNILLLLTVCQKLIMSCETLHDL